MARSYRQIWHKSAHLALAAVIAMAPQSYAQTSTPSAPISSIGKSTTYEANTAELGPENFKTVKSETFKKGEHTFKRLVFEHTPSGAQYSTEYRVPQPGEMMPLFKGIADLKRNKVINNQTDLERMMKAMRLQQHQQQKMGLGTKAVHVAKQTVRDGIGFFAAGLAVECAYNHFLAEYDDPKCVETGLMHLTSVEGNMHFFAFIWFNMQGQAYIQKRLANLEPKGAIGKKALGVTAGLSGFASMAYASLMASFVTENIMGIKNCTLSAMVEAPEKHESEEELQQYFKMCDDYAYSLYSGAMFERMVADAMFHLIPAAMLAHAATQTLNGTIRATGNINTAQIKALQAVEKTTFKFVVPANKPMQLAFSALRAPGRTVQWVMSAGGQVLRVAPFLAQWVHFAAFLASMKATEPLREAGYSFFNSMRLNRRHDDLKSVIEKSRSYEWGADTAKAGSTHRQRHRAVPGTAFDRTQGLALEDPRCDEVCQNLTKQVVGSMHEFHTDFTNFRAFKMEAANRQYANWFEYVMTMISRHDSAKIIYYDVIEKIKKMKAMGLDAKAAQEAIAQEYLDGVLKDDDGTLKAMLPAADVTAQAYEAFSLTKNVQNENEFKTPYMFSDRLGDRKSLLASIPMVKADGSLALPELTEVENADVQKRQRQFIQENVIKRINTAFGQINKYLVPSNRDYILRGVHSSKKNAYTPIRRGDLDADMHKLKELFRLQKTWPEAVLYLTDIFKSRPDMEHTCNQLYLGGYYCALNVIYSDFGKPQNMANGLDYLESMNAYLTEAELLMEKNPLSSQNMSYDNLAEYALGQMVCGPSIKEFNTENFQVTDSGSALNVITPLGWAYNWLMNEDQVIAKTKGFSLGFNPPRVVKDLSTGPNGRPVVCSGVRPSNYIHPSMQQQKVWDLKYSPTDKPKVQYRDLFAVLYDYLDPELLNNLSTRTRFDEWWEDNIGLHYFNLLAQSEESYKGVVDHTLFPSLFGVEPVRNRFGSISKFVDVSDIEENSSWFGLVEPDKSEFEGRDILRIMDYKEVQEESNWFNRVHHLPAATSAIMELDYILGEVMTPAFADTKDQGLLNFINEFHRLTIEEMRNLYGSVSNEDLKVSEESLQRFGLLTGALSAVANTTFQAAATPEIFSAMNGELLAQIEEAFPTLAEALKSTQGGQIGALQYEITLKYGTITQELINEMISYRRMYSEMRLTQ